MILTLSLVIGPPKTVMGHPLLLVVGTASDGYLDLDEIRWYNVPLTSEVQGHGGPWPRPSQLFAFGNGSEVDCNWSCSKEIYNRQTKLDTPSDHGSNLPHSGGCWSTFQCDWWGCGRCPASSWSPYWNCSGSYWWCLALCGVMITMFFSSSHWRFPVRLFGATHPRISNWGTGQQVDGIDEPHHLFFSHRRSW